MPENRKIALIRPHISGHIARGTGIYTDQLYRQLRDYESIYVELDGNGADLSGFDLVHYPYFDPFFLTMPFLKKIKTVVTVHDLIPLRFPDYFPRGIRGELKWQIQRRSLNKCDAVITDSHFSKGDIMKYAGVPEEKIRVIYLASDEEFTVIQDRKALRKNMMKKFSLPEKFLLFVGDVNYNKNVTGLLQAFARCITKRKNLHLLLVGRGFTDTSLELAHFKRQLGVLGLEKKVLMFSGLTKEELSCFYNLACGFVQPSFAEGFGLPLLEAFACGCPVASSKAGSLPEVGADACLYFDPHNTEEMAVRMEELADCENSSRKIMIVRGLTRAKQFSWKKCAEETVKVYERVIRGEL